MSEQTEEQAQISSMKPGLKMNGALLSIFRYRRRKFDDAIKESSNMLKKNPLDKAMWLIKCKSLTAKQWVDDTELEDDGIAEILLDSNNIADAPRPGTSFSRPTSSRQGDPAASGMQGKRPMTKDGRPLSGYSRPGTGSRPTSSSNSSLNVEAAFQGSRPGTSRPITSSGRFVRLGTASMKELGDDAEFIKSDKLDLKKYSTRPAMAKAICDYLLYFEHNPKKALELAAYATAFHEFKDWWWKARLGKCYYQLGLLRDAEKQFLSSLKNENMIVTNLELAKVYLKLDQPNKALEVFQKAAEVHQSDVNLTLGSARIHDMMNNIDLGIKHYETVLDLDGSNVEALACLASNYFYNDQPEVALRLYRRLLQMGVNTAEIWNNLGLCCFYSSQYDMAIGCFQRALSLSDDSNMSDVWYNIGHVGISIGDINLAYEAFKISLSIDGNNAESFNCLGVLEMRRGNQEESRNNFLTAVKLAPHLYEPLFNCALNCYKSGNYQEGRNYVSKALEAYPGHHDSVELLGRLDDLLL